jgi:hypothetical protein
MKADSLSRLVQALGINSIPIVGVFFDDWSTATTLVVYWSETLLAAVFTAARIAVHRKFTRKKGHYRDRWERSPRSEKQQAPPRQRFKTFLAGFLVGSLTLTAGLGLFLALLLATVLEGTIDRATIESGVFWMIVAQAAGFGWDLFGIREKPFAWVRDAANDLMGRVVLVHLAMLTGMFVLSWYGGEATAFFGTFVMMKFAADVIGLVARYRTAQTAPGKTPAWMEPVFARFDPKNDYEVSWREHRARSLAREEEDEQVYDSAITPGAGGA